MTDATPEPEPTPVSIENVALPTGQALPIAAEETPAVPATEPPISPVTVTPLPAETLPIPPVTVTVVAPTPPTLVAKSEGVVLAPTTTEEGERVSRGQRRLDILKEATQAIIALSITFAIIYLAIVQTPAETITNGFFLIIGFYFSYASRAANGNHGATGAKSNEPSIGGG